MIYLRAYARGNLGDDLFIRKVCNQYKNQKFYLLADKKYKKVFNDIKNLRIMHYSYKILRKNRGNHSKWLKINNRILKRISKKCDTYLYVGGSIFIENEKIGLNALKELKDEMSLFKKSYIIGANFGPYSSSKYFNYVHDELIPFINHISFRDLNSYELFKDRNNTSYAPDIVFSIENDSSTSKCKEVGISLIHHLERKNLKLRYDDYLKELVNLAIIYIKRGFKIRILSFCAYECDPVAIDDFMSKLPAEYENDIVIDYYDGNIDYFIDIISRLEILIATRFHSVVLGFKNNCKVIPICYSNKSVNLLNDLNINEYVTFDTIDRLSTIKFSKISSSKLNYLKKYASEHFNFLDFD